MAKDLKKAAPKGSDSFVDEISEDFDRFEAWVIENGKYLVAACVVLVLLVAIVFTVIVVRNSAARRNAEMFARAKTIEEINAALEKAPSALSAQEARFRLASLYLEKKDYAAARTQLEQVSRGTSNAFLAAKATLSMGYLDELTGKKDDALKLFAGVADNVQTQPDLRAEAAYAAGRICFEQKNFERARSYLARFRADQGTVSGVWGTYAAALLRQIPAAPAAASAAPQKKAAPAATPQKTAAAPAAAASQEKK